MHSFILVDLKGDKEELSIGYNGRKIQKLFNQLSINSHSIHRCLINNQTKSNCLILVFDIQFSVRQPNRPKFPVYNINLMRLSIFLLIVLLTFFIQAQSRCAYKVLDDGTAQKVDTEPHIVTGLTECVEYNNKLGCCDVNNDNSQVASYKEIDGVFGSQGGGCDICGINMKRFWCEYACSPRQSQFMQTSQELYPYPDPKTQNGTVMVQRVNLTVHADTACDLYNSCKRIGFVTSVSAMGSPAGFLNFQGHNAVDDAFQYIDVKFSYDTKNSLYFNDVNKATEPERSRFQACNFTSQKNSRVHGFKFSENCTCNNCEDTCDSSSGFIYTEPAVLEDFNWQLVLITWAASLAIAGAITFKRYRSSKQKVRND